MIKGYLYSSHKEEILKTEAIKRKLFPFSIVVTLKHHTTM